MFFLYLTRLPNFCEFAFCECVHTSKSARLYSVCASRLMFLFFCLPSISLQLGSLPCFSDPSLLPCSSSLCWDVKAAADSRRSSCVCPHVHVWGLFSTPKNVPAGQIRLKEMHCTGSELNYLLFLTLAALFPQMSFDASFTVLALLCKIKN